MYSAMVVQEVLQGNESLKVRSEVAGRWMLTMTNWEPSLKLILFQLHEKLQKNSMSTILWSFGTWSKLERWKSLVNEWLMSWPPPQKSIVLKCHLPLFYVTTMSHFSIRLWCVMKSGFYMTTDQLSGWTEKKFQSTSQSQTCTKKESWSLFGGQLLVWSTIAFWILAKPLHLRSMLSKSMRCTENCNACSRQRSTERAQFFLRQRPTTRHTTSTSKVEWIGLWSFASSDIFTWPFTDQRPLLTTSW